MIGILTLHNAINYGAILQTYALQHKLDLLGIQNQVIDYKCPKITNRHKIKFKWWNPLGYAIKMRTKRKFKQFLNTKVRLSKAISSLNRVTPCDAYLVGSDQVWNLTITGNDMTYFLDSVPKEALKYSYAASMGAYQFTSSDAKDKCLALLNEFSSLSVREKTGKQYLEECSKDTARNLSIAVHLDPVLLLKKEEWEKFGCCKQKRKYILLYMIGRQEELIHWAQELSKQLSLPVIWISDSLRSYQRIKNKRCSSPEEFVGLFSNSAYVVTNSFHGTAFSIMFHKPFYTVTRREGKRVERIADLLDTVGLQNCSLEFHTSVETADSICWDDVDQKLHSAVLDAEQYLTKMK